MSYKEIEIKLLFQNKQKVLSILLPRIKLKEKSKIYDTYYGQKHFDMKNTHELVRIRKNSNHSAELTFKGKAKDSQNIWHRKELTTKIESAKLMEQILLSLGFQKIRECVSEREHWQMDNLSIVFSKFTKPASLEFMEIEGKSKKEIKKIIDKLGNSVQEAGEEIFAIFDKN